MFLVSMLKNFFLINAKKKSSYFFGCIVFFLLRVRALRIYLKALRASKKTGVKMATPHEFHRKSDRVYILGSGSSVKGISNWEEISKHDSIGFNFWPLH